MTPRDTLYLCQRFRGRSTFQSILCGNQAVTQFVVSTLAESAGKVVAEHARAALSDRVRDLFLQLLDDAPPPNQVLRNAAKSCRKHLAS